MKNEYEKQGKDFCERFGVNVEIKRVVILVLTLIFLPLVTTGISYNWNRGIFFFPAIII